MKNRRIELRIDLLLGLDLALAAVPKALALLEVNLLDLRLLQFRLFELRGVLRSLTLFDADLASVDFQPLLLAKRLILRIILVRLGVLILSRPLPEIHVR